MEHRTAHIAGVTPGCELVRRGISATPRSPPSQTCTARQWGPHTKQALSFRTIAATKPLYRKDTITPFVQSLRCSLHCGSALRAVVTTALSLCAAACSDENRQPEVTGDEHALDLGGPFPDLEDLRVSVETADGRVVHEPGPTEDLRGFARVHHGGI